MKKKLFVVCMVVVFASVLGINIVGAEEMDEEAIPFHAKVSGSFMDSHMDMYP